ncbi:hypothetical protein ACYOEI_17465 [Singulisphaera rosea]
MAPPALGENPSPSGRDTLRIAVVVHLAAVLISALFARLERMHWLPDDRSILAIPFGLVLLASLLAWLACPIVILATVLGRRPAWPSVYAVLAEGILCYGQFIAMLPLVQ